MSDANIVILAGGISSRMKQISVESEGIETKFIEEARNKSKSMMSVGKASRPFLDYLLYNIEQAGYRNVVIVVGEHDSSIKNYYEINNGKKQFPYLNFKYAVQKIPPDRVKPIGTADALSIALKSVPEWCGKKFCVVNSDNLYSVKALTLLLKDNHPNCMIDYDRSTLSFEHERIESFSVIRKDNDKYLVDIIEKPSLDEINMTRDLDGRIGVSMNIFKFSYNMILPVLDSVPLHPVRQEKELPVAVKMLIEQYPRSLYTIPLAEHVIDLTSIKDIKIVQEYLQNEFHGFKKES